ncbi:GNAT family N-acetyltransferase [Sorangium sp. So ce1151]|uniref:GNAT family N-acetyltransferase n=1 Tax=Sorangium sp. So ce1151 TaxID=3133332 RepID=UPI003F629902
MLALAHHLQGAIDWGLVADRAAVARKLGLTRAGVTQFVDMLLSRPLSKPGASASKLSTARSHWPSGGSGPWRMPGRGPSSERSGRGAPTNVKKADRQSRSVVSSHSMSELSYAAIASLPVSDSFFDTLRADYPGFDDWLRRKAGEPAYLARREDGGFDGFLYLKREDGPVTDVKPPFASAKRLKVGTLKVNPHGTRLGERLLKKVFDHATEQDVDEIYVTVFPKHKKLIELFARYGFVRVGEKTGPGGTEDVMVRSLRRLSGDVVRDYPLINTASRKFLLALYPQWHTRLLPDSKLHTESPDIVKDVSHTNSIHKVYLTGMKGIEQLRRGDLLVIYRTGDGAGPAHYRSVATSICTAEEVRDISTFASVNELLAYCAPYSVFTDQELRGFWTNRKYPTLIRFTYNAALKKRLTRADLIDHGVIDPNAYAGFAPISDEGFKVVVERGGIHASLVVHQT